MADLYELDALPAPPSLPGTVVVRPTTDELIDAVAADLVMQAHACVRTFGNFQLALSGGSTPVPLYRRLMYDPNYRGLPWGRTHLWVVDERRVPFDDERCNFKTINEIIGEHSDIPREQVHPIFAMLPDADAQYAQTLRDVLGWREKGQDRLDFVLLGMGSDAHTASLFPHSPALVDRASDSLVRVNAGPSVTPPDRVTMTLHLLNASRCLAVMVTGKGKRAMIERVAAAWSGRSGARVDDRLVHELPVLGLSPLAGELRWYLDFAACPGMPEPA
jgi:6-phosphogluconolactonase